jgi:hypothetical protein
MTLIPVNIATEDELSELTLLRLLTSINRFAVGRAYRRGGFGYLRRTVEGWNAAARGIPFIVLTDLDAGTCAPRMIAEWLSAPKHPNLIFRVAVREVEAWLLADSHGLSEFFGIKKAVIPSQPEVLPNPKAALVDLARRSRYRKIRNGIVPRTGSTAQQGPDYNGCLAVFVKEQWNINAARANSPSLASAIDSLVYFTPTWL